MPKVALTVVIPFLLIACGQECLLHPCPIPMALEVVVTSQTSGGAIPGASVTISGAASSSVSCDSACIIPGYAGTYNVVASAPGYQLEERTVSVEGINPDCGCASAQTQQVSFVLTPTPTLGRNGSSCDE